MKYINSFDIWNIPVELLRHTQAGQWIYAGDKTHKGIYLGVKKTGVIVVAWKDNIKSQTNKLEYIKTLRNYAKN